MVNNQINKLGSPRLEGARTRALEQRAIDADVVRRVQGGEREAYRELVLKYQHKIYGFVQGAVTNPEDAREITQEAFIHVYRGLDRFRFDSSFYTLLYRVAVNKTKRYQQSKIQTNKPQDSVEPTSLDHSPERLIERRQLMERIESAIDQLPQDQQTAIRLRELEGLSYSEIAQAMDCAEGTVMSRLFYGRKKLQEILK
jgi:RNA polymerase sigma-70 factor, ECF subfamily